MEIQHAILIYAGLVFEPVRWLCGYRQGGPFSTLIFVMVVSPFLSALADIPGVRATFGFCDDWEASINGLAPVPRIRELVSEFETASGQRIHRTKTKWIANRMMTRSEHQLLCSGWPGAVVATRDIVLGTPFGHGVTTVDFT